MHGRRLGTECSQIDLGDPGWWYRKRTDRVGWLAGRAAPYAGFLFFMGLLILGHCKHCLRRRSKLPTFREFLTGLRASFTHGDCASMCDSGRNSTQAHFAPQIPEWVHGCIARSVPGNAGPSRNIRLRVDFQHHRLKGPSGASRLLVLVRRRSYRIGICFSNVLRHIEFAMLSSVRPSNYLGPGSSCAMVRLLKSDIENHEKKYAHVGSFKRITKESSSNISQYPTMSAASPKGPFRLVTVNTAPERAKRLIGIVVEKLKDTYTIEHVANCESMSSTRVNSNVSLYGLMIIGIEDVEGVVKELQPNVLVSRIASVASVPKHRFLSVADVASAVRLCGHPKRAPLFVRRPRL